VIGAVIIIEAAGLGGPMLPVILLPGLLASGIGSLVFVGIGALTGLNTDAYALPPLSLAPYPEPTVAAFLWTILLALAAAVVVFVVVELAKTTRQLVAPRPFLMFPAAALAVGLIAIAFSEISDQTANVVLFSGQEAMSDMLKDASTISLGTLGFLIACKALAWAISMGAARGGPTFPAIFLGLAGGLLAAHLPGFDQTPAIGVLVGAAVVSVLRLPLSAIVIALLITQAGLGVAPLVIVAVVIAYIAVLLLDARRTAAAGTRSKEAPPLTPPAAEPAG
jgi:chloride channel protein, CIC family